MSPVTRRFFGMIAIAATGCFISAALVRGQATPPAPTGTATITGTVTSNGAPVSGATVSLMAPRKARGGGGPANPPTTQPTPQQADPGQGGQGGAGGGGGRRGGARAKPLQTTTTGADGKYTFSNVAAGTYSVTARLTGTGNGRAQAVVADGATVTVDITLTQRARGGAGGGGGGGGQPPAAPPAN